MWLIRRWRFCDLSFLVRKSKFNHLYCYQEKNITVNINDCCFKPVCSQGHVVAVGTHKGLVQVWDVTANKRLSALEGHSARVGKSNSNVTFGRLRINTVINNYLVILLGALAWNGDMLSSGSRDRLIFQRDVRTPCIAPERRLGGHRQEACDLCSYQNIFFLLYVVLRCYIELLNRCERCLMIIIDLRCVG